ncbi:MAG: hypothetical protein COY80_02730 [Candidatus Pacebacteria bacterium CG_4_10_14_0_8_um_filter_42_14]|nr:MAG: hypothetical protein COY80_02730 [Candidatus Pacebacteria bacterium CG_4_10_14_0_8_um_filter_42_14]
MINLSDYNEFYLFLGGLSVICGITYLFFRDYLQSVFISDDELSKIDRLNSNYASPISLPRVILYETGTRILLKRLSFILLVIIIAGIIFNQFLMFRIGSPWT